MSLKKIALLAVSSALIFGRTASAAGLRSVSQASSQSSSNHLNHALISGLQPVQSATVQLSSGSQYSRELGQSQPDAVGSDTSIVGCDFSSTFSSAVGDNCKLIGSVFSGDVDIRNAATVTESQIQGNLTMQESSHISGSNLQETTIGYLAEVFESLSENPISTGSYAHIHNSNLFQQQSNDQVSLSTNSDILDCDIYGSAELGSHTRLENAEVYSGCEVQTDARVVDPQGYRMVFQQGLFAGNGVKFQDVPVALLEEHSQLVEAGDQVVRQFPERFHIVKRQDGFLVVPQVAVSESSPTVDPAVQTEPPVIQTEAPVIRTESPVAPSSKVQPDQMGAGTNVADSTFSSSHSSLVGDNSNIVESTFEGTVDIGDSVTVSDSVINGSLVMNDFSHISGSTLEDVTLGLYTEVFESTSENPISTGPHSQIHGSKLFQVQSGDEVRLSTNGDILNSEIYGSVQLGVDTRIENAEVRSFCQLDDRARIVDSQGHRLVFNGGIYAEKDVVFSEIPSELIDAHSAVVSVGGQTVRLFSELFHVKKNEDGYVASNSMADISDVLSGSNSNFPSVSPSVERMVDDLGGGKKKAKNKGAIIGGTVGGVIALVSVGFLLYRYRKQVSEAWNSMKCCDFNSNSSEAGHIEEDKIDVSDLED